MRFRLLDAADPAQHAAWMALWRAWPDREPTAHPEYVRLFARPGDRAVCAAGEAAGRTILFPLVLRPLAAEPWAPVDEARWDAVTPYGYGGPFAFGPAADTDAEFWTAYVAFCRDAGLVSTFARLALFPEALATGMPGRIEVRGPNVVRDLRVGLEAIWKDYDRTVRNNVRCAERAGLRVEVDETGARLDAFLEIYAHTMDRRQATDFYRFPRAFFEALCSKLSGQIAFVHAIHGDEVVGSELLLVSTRFAYAFLGGTRADAFQLRPNDLVRHGSVEWGVARGKEALVLGGGYAPNDGILRHKRNLAPRGEVPFKVACMMHDEPAYHALARARAAHARAAGTEWTPRDGYFPVYRG